VEYAEDESLARHSNVEWMSSGFILTDKSNAWAGPDHWKYRCPRGTWHPLQLNCLKHPWPLLLVLKCRYLSTIALTFLTFLFDFSNHHKVVSCVFCLCSVQIGICKCCMNWLVSMNMYISIESMKSYGE